MPKQKSKTHGEPFVWLTAMGLAVGLIMVVGLLGLIISKGVVIFWPKPVAQIELKSSEDGAPSTLEGEIVLKQVKALSPSLDATSTSKKELLEWQVYQGNKDVLGQTFRFIDQDDVKSVTYPKDVMVLDRMEYGKALGVPVEIHIGKKEIVPAQSPVFKQKLASLEQASVKRWEEIRHLEKDKIGAINSKMEGLELKKRRLENKKISPVDLSEKISSIEIKKQKLQENYQALANEVNKLRAQQQTDKFVYRLVSGETREIELGQIIHYYYPNQLSFFGKITLFLHNAWVFVSTEPREANTEGGVFPALFGTLVMTIMMSLAVVPFGVLAAIYLREYVKQGVWVRLVRIAVNNLAGVPSIVFGVFGLGFFVYFLGGRIDAIFFSDKLPTPTFGTGGILWASLTLALMTVPVVIVSTEEALAAVSRGTREGALACGASKWQAIQRIIMPASAPGILTGMILAMARGAGEVAPLMLVGVVKLAPTLPINSTFPYIHLNQKFMHLGFYIYDLGFQSPDSEAAKPMVFATALLLIILVLVLNMGAILLRERLRKKYATGAF